MVDMNYFNASLSQMDRMGRTQLSDILAGIKEGADLVNNRLATKLSEIQKKKDYINVETPV